MLILGHRGYRSKFVENTIKAIQKALEYGADGVECDIQKIGSNHFVVFHDSNLLRMANIDKNLLECNKENIEIIRINGEEKIPFLEELLDVFPKDKFINIEIKKETITLKDCKQISLIIKEKFGLKNVLISSFEHSFLPIFKKHGFKIGMLLGLRNGKTKISSIFLKILNIKPDYINFPIDIFEILGIKKASLLLKILKLIGKKIVLWTVNNDKYSKEIKKNADIIITDNVELIIELFKKV